MQNIERLYKGFPRNFITPYIVGYEIISRNRIKELSKDRYGEIYGVTILEENSESRYGLISIRELSTSFTSKEEALKYYNSFK